MKKRIISLFESIEPDKEKSPLLHTLYDGFFTFAFTPNHVTSGKGVHIRDGMDLKRTMVFVVLALQLCFAFGTYNIGQQHFEALGQFTGYLEALHLKLAHGFIKFLPQYVVAMAVGLGIEFFYASKKGHPIEEGFLVSGALIPLIMPPDLPLWILAVSVVFAVIIGKEAFGGTGMNILNVAPSFPGFRILRLSDLHLGVMRCGSRALRRSMELTNQWLTAGHTVLLIGCLLPSVGPSLEPEGPRWSMVILVLPP
jgi:Na+-transporting NADH:ubiquinone oxidoreductase subunit B